MGSVIRPEQVDLDGAMAKRNKTFGVDHTKKAEARKGIEVPEIHERMLSTASLSSSARAKNTSRCELLVERLRQQSLQCVSVVELGGPCEDRSLLNYKWTSI